MGVELLLELLGFVLPLELLELLGFALPPELLEIVLPPELLEIVLPPELLEVVLLLDEGVGGGITLSQPGILSSVIV